MATQIWNQGRVVGYSAYEIYVKQHLAEHPDEPIASERQWLAASIGSGSSLLLVMPEVRKSGTRGADSPNNYFYIDIPLPRDSILAAANTIVASLFLGDAGDVEQFAYVPPCSSVFNAVEGTGGWAKSVQTYGFLLDNPSINVPEGEKTTILSENISSDIPSTNITSLASLGYRIPIRSYMQIVDGIVIQPGYWENSSRSNMHDFSPILYNSEGGLTVPVIRLLIKGPIDNSGEPFYQTFNILLTGFTIRSVLSGTVDETGSINPDAEYHSPENGDFLGPEVFPWANKIIFSVPNGYIQTFANDADYIREIESTISGRVATSSIVDMSSGSGDEEYEEPALKSYYHKSIPDEKHIAADKLFYPDAEDYWDIVHKKEASTVPMTVRDFWTAGDGASVLAVYEKSSKYPPALYGTVVDKSGEAYLDPIDVVAPGSVKMFHNATEEDMLDYQQTFPGTTSVNLTEDNVLEVIDSTTNEKVCIKSGDIATTNTPVLLGTELQINPGYIASPVYVYSDPDTSSEVIGSLEHRKSYEVSYYKYNLTEDVSETEKGTWANVSYDSTHGWIHVSKSYAGLNRSGETTNWRRTPKYLTYRRIRISDSTVTDNGMYYVINPDVIDDLHVFSGATLSKVPVSLMYDGYYLENNNEGDGCNLLTDPANNITRLSRVNNYNASTWGISLPDSGTVPANLYVSTPGVLSLDGTAKFCEQLGGPLNTLSDMYIPMRYFGNLVEYGNQTYIDLTPALGRSGYILIEPSKNYKYDGLEFWWYPLGGSYTTGYITSTRLKKLTLGDDTVYVINMGRHEPESEVQLNISYPYELMRKYEDASTQAEKDAYVLSLAADFRGNNNITWDTLLHALGNDCALDILQDRLKSIQKTLIRSRSTGVGPYIEFGTVANPIRLYISNNEPETEDVPVGSIGIGWGFNS